MMVLSVLKQTSVLMPHNLHLYRSVYLIFWLLPIADKNAPDCLIIALANSNRLQASSNSRVCQGNVYFFT